MLKGKISLENVAGEVTAGVGKCTLLGMRQERACNVCSVALLGLSSPGFGVTHGKQYEHEEINLMLTQKQTFFKFYSSWLFSL